MELRPADPPALASIAYIDARLGKKDEARKILGQLMETSKKQYVASIEIAAIFAGLDDADSAMLWLEKAYRQRESQVPFIKSDDRFNPLNSDPRFQDLIRRLGLPA
jgi:SLT domain-containing protein